MYISKKINPMISVLFSFVEVLLANEKIATPSVIRNASTYCPKGYEVPFKNLPIIITGMILEDLNTVWTGNETYFNDAYWDQLLKVLLIAQGEKLHNGA